MVNALPHAQLHLRTCRLELLYSWVNGSRARCEVEGFGSGLRNLHLLVVSGSGLEQGGSKA